MLTATASQMASVWLSLAAKGVYGSAFHQHAPYYNTSSCSTSTQTLPGTIPPPQTSTIEYSTSSECTTKTETSVPSTVVVSPSSTPHYTNTTIDSTTTTTVSSCSTKTVTAATYSTTVLTSSSTTTVVPSTITSSASFPSYTFSTSTVYQECPTTCSISAGTVNLFFWPTNNDYSYPATYVDTSLDYTFTSPSVYMLINTIYGYNSLGRTGPSATSTIFALDLDEVSTIVPGGSATRQLSLSDLGTDCPQSADPTAILTMTDSRCDPTLVAPNIVKAWARPCNACGRFGLFDPPYAIPTITGGLLGTTTATVATTTSTATAATGATSTVAATTQTAVTTAAATTTAAEAVTTTSAITLGPSGLVVVYYYSGTSSTATIPETGSVVTYGTQTLTRGSETATQTSIATIETSSVPTGLTGSTATSTAVTTTSAPDSSTATLTDGSSTTTAATTGGDPGSTTSAVPTASAAKLTGGFTFLVISILASICML